MYSRSFDAQGRYPTIGCSWSPLSVPYCATSTVLSQEQYKYRPKYVVAYLGYLLTEAPYKPLLPSVTGADYEDTGSYEQTNTT